MSKLMSSGRSLSGRSRIRLFLSLAAVALVMACATRPQQPTNAGVQLTVLGGGKYFPTESPFAVGVIPDATVHDAFRNRDVVMTIEYPSRGGPYPVIVFSHAYGSSKDAYVAMTEYWVGHGYVCIKPSHVDAGAVREAFMPRMEGRGQRGGRDRGSRPPDNENENRRSGTSPGVQVTNVPQQPAPETHWQNQTAADWKNRARDITVILDSITTLEQKYPELAGKIDQTKIGVGGDSYGAFTTMLLSGMKSFKTTPPLQLTDPRVRAGLAISPQGVSDVFGLTAESWRDVKIPMMYMTGSADRGLGENGDPKWRHDPFAFSAAGDKYFVSFAGASHSSFAGNGGAITDADVMRNQRPGVDPWGNQVGVQQQPTSNRGMGMSMGSRRILGSVQFLTIAFWDAYLKGDTNALDYLRSEKFLAMNSGATTVERK